MIDERDLAALDAKLMELMASRLCHDLASPVGAVMSGLELMQEFEDETADDALRLMGDSARIAARRLAFYRLAFGFAGNARNLTVGEARAG
jgi:histidine phosphotransferase ChpT